MAETAASTELRIDASSAPPGQARETAHSARKPPRGLSLAAREALWGYLFISPWLLGLLAFSLGPIVAVVYFSFTEYSVLEAPVWIGARNYQRMLSGDALFWKSLQNTLYYVALNVPLLIGLGFGLALLLNRGGRGVTAYRSAYYLPTIVPAVASSIVWIWMLNPEIGPIRLLLSLVGLQSPLWLQSEEWSKPALVLVSLWSVGTPMVVFLAGLQNVPRQLYEAANIDGAGPVQRLLNVTVPLMTPVVFFNLVIALINSFQVFVYAFLMTKGGPLNSSLMYVLHLYRNAFEFFRMGYASALAVVLFLIALLATLLVFWGAKWWVYYESR